MLSRPPFGSAHEPAAAAAPANVTVVGAGCAGCAEDDAEELHPAAITPPARLATLSATGAILRYLATRCLIKTTFYSSTIPPGRSKPRYQTKATAMRQATVAKQASQ